MKINIVAVDENLQTIGLRRMHSYISTLDHYTTPYYIPLGRFSSLRQILSGRYGRRMKDDGEAVRMAEPIADAAVLREADPLAANSHFDVHGVEVSDEAAAVARSRRMSVTMPSSRPGHQKTAVTSPTTR